MNKNVIANTVGEQYPRNPRHLAEHFGLPNRRQVVDDLQTATESEIENGLNMITKKKWKRIKCQSL